MILYLLKLTLYWGLSYGFYACCLSKLTFFHLNRFWILVNLALGLLWPFVLPISRAKSGGIWVQLPLVEIQANVLSQVQTTTSGWHSSQYFVYWPWVYGIISCYFFYRFTSGLLQIWQLKRTSSISHFDGHQVLMHDSINQPFSFSNALFLPKKHRFSDDELQQILRHELVHIQEKHSLDILFCEVLKCIFWWNPFIYFWKSSLQDLHEFTADFAVLRTYSPQQYGRLLLSQVESNHQLAPVHSIFQSPIKKRIHMMTTSVSKNQSLTLYALFVPLVIAFYAATATAQTTSHAGLPVHQLKTLIDTITTYDPVTMEETVKIVTNEYYESAQIPPVFGKCSSDLTGDALQKCSNQNFMRYLAANIQYPKAARDAKIEGKVYVSFIIEKDGTPSAVQIMRGLSEECDNEVIRFVKSMEKWNPGRMNDKPVAVKFTMPILFKLE